MRFALPLAAIAVTLTATHWAGAVVAQQSTVPTNTDAGELAELRAAIAGGDHGNVHSVLAMQRGRLVVEWYFEGPDERLGTPLGVVTFNAGTLHDLRSMTKSVVSLLFGIAMADGAIDNVDETLDRYFFDYGHSLTPAHSHIHLRHLLSMTSGIRWDERTYPYTDPRNSETAMHLADDRVQMILSEPIGAPPGERFNYSAADVEMIAVIIERATGTPLKAFAADRLFGPLGIEQVDWLEYPNGGPVVASGLRMRPLDMLKLAKLADNGTGLFECINQHRRPCE